MTPSHDSEVTKSLDPDKSTFFELFSLPNYEIQCELGRGGMGVVYKAKQAGLDRTVALKMILHATHAGDHERQRFLTEAKAVAQLQHPNIVQIYEIGEHDGLPYFSLEFCSGGNLAEKLHGTPLTPTDAAQLAETLARAVQFAHEHQLIHRDLKPANVLLAEDGQPKITDFGLVKKLDDARLTQSGAIIGSPSYMSPEQARGLTTEVGTGVDVYGLGAILYELLTGRPPFKAATVMETLEQVSRDAPVSPRLLQPNTPRDLEIICLTCLNKEPDRRYASAQEVADDLQRFLNGESISIRPAGFMDRLTRTLGQDRLRGEFHVWGNLLLLFAVIIVVGHSLLHYCYLTRQHILFIIGIDCVQFALMALIFWVVSRKREAPIITEEHKLWLLGIGYIMACALARLIVNYQTPDSQMNYEMREYPFWFVLAALLFFMMGGAYWGRCYLFSAVFAVSSVLVPVFFSSAGPLLFGILWGLFLWSFGIHLRRLGRQG